MSSYRPPVIGFLTDFGLDGAAATCRAVMLSICPDARIVDISHTVAKYAIRDGAYLLRAALPWFPIGVHVGVVDPGVGTDRRPVAVRAARGDVLIGPDNGLLVPAAEALGGVAGARELTNRDLWLSAASSTFHGRDLFSPVAAHLAARSAPFEAVGTELAGDALVRLPEADAVIQTDRIETEVVYVDSFGNLRLAGGPTALHEAFGDLPAGSRVRASIADGEPLATTFAPSFGHVPPGATLLYVDSAGNLALAANQADLAARTRARTGLRVTIERA